MTNVWFQQYSGQVGTYENVKQKCLERRSDVGADRGYPPFFENDQEYDEFIGIETRKERQYLGIFSFFIHEKYLALLLKVFRV